MPLSAELALALLLWSLLALGSAVAGLYAGPPPFWRGFWLMSGLWGLVDGGIAWATLAFGPTPAADLAPLLKVNAGLDVGYVAVGAVLLRRYRMIHFPQVGRDGSFGVLMVRRVARRPLGRGFGLAVAGHGLFLLAFDVYYWLRASIPEGT